MFESLNFNIILILILFASALLGLYYSLHRQIKKTLSLIMPFIFLYFGFYFIYELSINISFIGNPIKVLINFFGIYKYKETTYSLVVYIISYFTLYIITYLLSSIYRVPIQKKVLNKTNPIKKIISLLLGLINGFVVGVVMLYCLSPFVKIDYDSFITKLYIKSSTDVIELTKLNQAQNGIVEEYEYYTNTLDILTGRNLLNKYYIIQEKLEYLDVEETIFIEEIYPNLSNDSKSLLESNNYLAKLIENVETVLENETNNEYLEQLNFFIENIQKEKEYISLRVELLDDYSLTNIHRYMTLNGNSEIQEQLDFYNNYSFQFYNLIEYIPSDFGQDIIYFEKYISTNYFIYDVFIYEFATEESEVINESIKIFKKAIILKEKLEDIKFDCSLSLKLVIANNYNFFSREKINKSKILNSYINDSISNENIKANGLYSEFIYYDKLLDGVENEIFLIDDINLILSNLSKLISSGIISEDTATKYLIHLLNNPRFKEKVDKQHLVKVLEIANDYLKN